LMWDYQFLSIIMYIN